MQIIFVNSIKDHSDKKKAFEIRNLVFCKEQKVSKKIEFDGLDQFCDHYIAKINELPIGTARVREQTRGTFKIERMAVLKPYRKKGVGKAIIKEILKNYLNLGKINKLVLNSQIEAKDFYKKFGFVEVGKVFIEANIKHQKMIYEAKMVPAHGLEPRT
tara:strand:- start:8 stop:481 length:474 start_codon:yes stop_codon:yes gene_type:complete